MEGLNCSLAQARSQSIGMARKACAPSGRAMVFYIPAFAAPWKGAQFGDGSIVQ